MGTHTLSDALGTALAGALPRLQAHAPRRKARSGAPHPTGARVLRDSVEAGTFEEVFFVPPAKGETDRILRAARRGLDAGRQLAREARAGARTLTSAERLLTRLTAASVRIFEEILTLARLNRGRVFPSYDWLAEATGLGRATVARALAILEAIGFLVRQRRFKRIEGDGPGPRYEQTSNAYRALLPGFLLAYLPRWMRPAPVPDDALYRADDQAEELAWMRGQLSCREWAQATVDGPLGKVLARLGAALDRQERESQINTQPLPDSFINEDQRSWPSRPTNHA
jgi:predicted transcriptional regulator